MAKSPIKCPPTAACGFTILFSGSALLFSLGSCGPGPACRCCGRRRHHHIPQKSLPSTTQPQALKTVVGWRESFVGGLIAEFYETLGLRVGGNGRWAGYQHARAALRRMQRCAVSLFQLNQLTFSGPRPAF